MTALRQLTRWAPVGTMVLLLGLGAAACAQEPSLPEIARQKTGNTAKRVFTNEDLETGRPAAPQLASTPAEKPPGEKKEKGRITLPGLLEEGTISEARSTLESLRRDELVLLRRYAQIQEKLVSEQDPHLRRLYSDSLGRRDETLARKRKQIEDVEKAIALAERDAGAHSRSKDDPKAELPK